MRQLHKALRENHHLRHGGRMQYGLFLKGIGLTLEQALQFWRSEFIKGKVDADKVNRTTRLTFTCSRTHLAHTPASVHSTRSLCWCTSPCLSFNTFEVWVTQTNESSLTVKGMPEIIWHSSSVSLIKKFWRTRCFFFFVPMVHLTRKLHSQTLLCLSRRLAQRGNVYSQLILNQGETNGVRILTWEWRSWCGRIWIYSVSHQSNECILNARRTAFCNIMYCNFPDFVKGFVPHHYAYKQCLWTQRKVETVSRFYTVSPGVWSCGISLLTFFFSFFPKYISKLLPCLIMDH